MPKTVDHFWQWSAVVDEAGAPARELLFDGPIASEEWFGDEITPAAFRAELNAEQGTVIVRINSPGGECIAGAAIYDMLREYGKNNTVVTHIEGIAASMASVVAMAGSVVEMNPTGMFMIHKSSGITWGNEDEIAKMIPIMQQYDQAIVNAYVEKTGRSKDELLQMMADETWMSATKALELGFVDKICDYKASPASGKKALMRQAVAYAYSARAAEMWTAGRKKTEDPTQRDEADEASRKLHIARMVALSNATNA